MASVSSFEEYAPSVSGYKRFTRVFFSRGLVLFGFIVILIFIFSAVFSPWIAPYDPYKPDINKTFLKPCLSHPLGTDSLGRDVLSRLIYGSRTSLIVCVVAIGLAAFAGMAIGLIAAFAGMAKVCGN